jgi:hypothetical protein
VATESSGPSAFARLLLVLLGLGFLGSAWVWSHRQEPWASRLVDRARRTVNR